MKRHLCLIVLLCIAAAGIAEAGQYRIAPPGNMRKRQPPRGYRESRLEIVNEDDRGYAIDVDYRRNRLELVHRARGDIYVPGNSRITLTFDDDDNWRILGDHESLEIEIRSGRTTTLRLETRANRHQVGLFATVQNGHRGRSVQLFKYHDRPGRPAVVQRPTPGPGPGRGPGPQHNPPPPPPPRHREPSKGEAIGAAVGGIIGSLVDDDKPDHRRR